MIEINLAPRAGRGRGGRRGGRRANRAAARLSMGLPPLDGWTLGASASVVVAVACCLLLLLSARGRAADAAAALQHAMEDSTKVAERSQAWEALVQQRDSIHRRMTLIESLDARRYAWPHLLDEISVALPAGVWLTRIAAIPDAGDRVRFQVEGNAPDNFTLTRFWNALEASFFIRDVHLVRTEHIAAPPAVDAPVGAAPTPYVGAASAPLYGFVLEAIEEAPPDDVLDLAPFGRAARESAEGAAAQAGGMHASEPVT